MNGYLAGFLAIITGITVAVIGELLSEEIRDRLDQVPRVILHCAAHWLDPGQRITVYREEWEPELAYILKGAEARPITRLIIGIRYALGILINTRRIARHLHRPAPREPEMAAAGAPAAAPSRHRPSWLQRGEFLAALGGARPEILKFVPTERIRFQSLGWAILFSSGISSASMWFGLSSALGMNGLLAAPLALCSGLVLLCLDRLLAVSLYARGRRGFHLAVPPRVLLALLLGVVFATPFVLRIFQPEINYEIYVMKSQQVAAGVPQQRSAVNLVTAQTGVVSSIQEVIDTRGSVASSLTDDQKVRSLTRRLQAELSLRQDSYQLWQCLLHRGSGCPADNGPLADAAGATYNQARQEVAILTGDLRQARYQRAVAALPAARRQMEAAISREEALREGTATSLLARMEALSRISSGNSIFPITRLMLYLLFATIQCLSVTLKLLQRPGLYEEVVAASRPAPCSP